MPVIVTCKCGQSFKAREDLLGKRVPCPACNQPLDIPRGEEPVPAQPVAPQPATEAPAASPKPNPAPAKPAPTPPLDDDPLGGLDDVAGFEQSAALATNAAGQIVAPGYAGHGAHADEGFSRGVVVAMWIGGGAVGLMLIAMVITAIIGVGGPDADPSVTEGASSGAVDEQDTGDEANGEDDSTADSDTGEAQKSSTKKAGKPADSPAAAPGDDEADAKSTTPKSKGSGKTAGGAGPGKKEPSDAESAGPAEKPAAKPAGVSVTLSAGTAVPQSLPSGTAMSFSVDYEFASGQPDPSAKYLWVIQASDGERLKEPRQLEAKGNLTAILPEFRPEQGPFETYMEDGNGKRISESHPLRK